MVNARDLDFFIQSALKLKSIKRAGWVSKVKVQSPESVADHSFATCAVGMLLADVLGLDTVRVMKMAILHDLAESIVGDYMPGDISVTEKIQKERTAVEKILKGLPGDVRSDYSEIWSEYLANRTEVARFVHRIDKLEMAMQASLYANEGYDRKLLRPFVNSARIAVGDSDDIVRQILDRFAQAHDLD